MKDNKYLRQIEKAKSLDRLNKISSHIGVNLGRIKDINKAKDKLIKVLEKEQKQVKKDYAKIQENLNAKRKEKTNSRNYNRVKSAEKQFKNSFRYLSDLEKEVFLNNKTVSFLDKFQVGSPLTFHDFKNKKEFDKYLNSIAPGEREQFIQDYLNSLKHNSPSEKMEELEKSFNKKKQGFYNPSDLNGIGLRDNDNLNNLFRELDYVRKMEMISIMDDNEYALMVESLVKMGHSEPLAMNIALKNLGFREDGEYQILE